MAFEVQRWTGIVGRWGRGRSPSSRNEERMEQV